MSVAVQSGSTVKLGTKVIIEPDSSFYPGPYEVEVLVVNDAVAVLRTPLHDGKLVILPVGATLRITDSAGQVDFSSEVLGRSFNGSPSFSVALPGPKSKARVIAVTSGKGGVGKTWFVVNAAVALAKEGLRVCVLDADLGTANVDVLLGLTPQYDLNHVIAGQKDILEVVREAPGGFHLVPGGTGLMSLADVEADRLRWLINGFEKLEAYADIILIDTGAGLSKNVVNLILAADDAVIVTTPEPHAIADAYAMVKVLSKSDKRPRCRLVVNMAEKASEGRLVGERIVAVARSFVGMEVDFLGHTPIDPAASKSIKRQTPQLIAYPNSPAAKRLEAIAQVLSGRRRGAVIEDSPEEQVDKGSFFSRIRDLVSRGD